MNLMCVHNRVLKESGSKVVILCCGSGYRAEPQDVRTDDTTRRSKQKKRNSAAYTSTAINRREAASR